jgi:methyltransferase (TIGR00027 family)
VWWPIFGGAWRRRIAARTPFFDNVTLTAIDAGITQVVILGAGYDARALRFAHPNVTFFEVDHPATQTDKRRRLATLGIATGATVCVPHDIAHGDLPGTLSAAGYARDRASLFICEGLLLYLTTPAIEGLLRDVRASAPPGSQLALSAREQHTNTSVIASLRQEGQRVLLAMVGEPRRSLLDAGQLDALLEQTGWKTIQQPSAAGPHDELRGTLVLAE